MKKSEANQNLQVVLRHPLRRQILATLLEGSDPRSPRQLSQTMCEPLSNVSYHVRVMVEREVLTLVATKPARGSVQHFYELSELGEHPMVKTTLDGDSDDDDEDLRAVRVRYGRNLRREREHAGMDRANLARLAGVNRQTIRLLETGEWNADFEMQSRLAGALEIDPGKLMEGIGWDADRQRFYVVD